MKNPGRQAFVGAVVLAVFGTIGSANDAWARPREVEDGMALKVGVYNYAHIGGSELLEAEDQAARLFARAGVRITWLDCPTNPKEVSLYPQCANRDVVLRILSASMSNHFDSHAEALGAAIPVSKPERAWVASVFNARVASISSSWMLDPGLVLGEAVAHELGHLLLGASHARDGIMRANWTQQDLKQASRGQLRFDATQAALLKETVRRVRAETAPQEPRGLTQPGQSASALSQP